MKKLLFILPLAAYLFLLTACQEPTPKPTEWIDLVTAIETQGKVSLVQDDSTVLTIVDGYTGYKPKATRQRVVVIYSYVDENKQAKTANVKLLSYKEILTKGLTPITTEHQADSVGKSKIGVYEVWTSQGYLNVDFGYWYSGSGAAHNISLAQNTYTKYPTNDTIYLEFRHNHNNDAMGYYGRGMASFDLSSLKSHITDSAVMKIKIINYAKDFAISPASQGKDHSILRTLYADKWLDRTKSEVLEVKEVTLNTAQ